MKLTVRQAAQLLSVSETQIYRWVEDGQIPCYTVRHQPLFSRAELLEWATAKRLPVSVELFAGGGRSTRLADALERGGIHHHVPGDDRPSLLRAVVNLLPLPSPADAELILPIMLAREAQASTGIGDGIAIPHVRMPLVFAGREAAVALCFLEHPIEFHAIDGKPVHTVFAMLTPTVRGHLQLLSRLSHALFDPGFLAAVKRRAPAAEILAEARRVDAGLPDEVDEDGQEGEDDDEQALAGEREER
jgi:PTS system nitrogen regulatory IIA component